MMNGLLAAPSLTTGLLLVVNLLLPPRATSQAAYVLERSSSRVMFQGRAFLRSVIGGSDDLAGAVSIRTGDIRSTRGNVRFPVASLETEPALEPRELRQLFGAEQHPDVIFLVDSIGDGAKNNHWAIHGRLTMNGVTRPVAFMGVARMLGRRMVASGSASIDLRDWRIQPPRRLGGLIGMSSKVQLTFQAEFRPRDGTHTALMFQDQ